MSESNVDNVAAGEKLLIIDSVRRDHLVKDSIGTLDNETIQRITKIFYKIKKSKTQVFVNMCILYRLVGGSFFFYVVLVKCYEY